MPCVWSKQDVYGMPINHCDLFLLTMWPVRKGKESQYRYSSGPWLFYFRPRASTQKQIVHQSSLTFTLKSISWQYTQGRNRFAFPVFDFFTKWQPEPWMTLDFGKSHNSMFSDVSVNVSLDVSGYDSCFGGPLRKQIQHSKITLVNNEIVQIVTRTSNRSIFEQELATHGTRY